MRILLSNDDGINAPGLEVLERVARSLSEDVWIVAPEAEQSGAAHSLTLDRPLRARRISAKRYAVDGTPTDCLMLAINSLMEGLRPSLMLSGVNRGANLADDVTYSGTIAAAMEATLLGVPAIALSQKCRSGRRVRWATAEHYAPGLVRRLVEAGWPEDVFINVNFPDVAAAKVKAIRVCQQGRRRFGDALSEGVDSRRVPYSWMGGVGDKEEKVPGCDIDVVNAGAIAVTPLCLDMTHGPTAEALRKALA